MDLYLVLGLERAATLDDIKRAYRRLARKYHPDINPGDRMAASHFRQIADAYETLSDPDRRRRYDMAGASVESAGPTAFGFEGFDFSVSVSGASASTFGDLFADALLAPLEAGVPQRGVDVHQVLSLTLDQAFAGGRCEVPVTRYQRCPACHGFGRLRAAERRCVPCQGIGAVRSARGHMVFSKPCAACGGTGAQASIRCGTCNGQQSELCAGAARVDVPAGVLDGDQLRVPEGGHAGRNGGEYGDLLLTVHVVAHSVFSRDGDDLWLSLPVAVHEAALGARVEIPAIDGQLARVRVPPGTQSGQRFRLRERGMPSARSGQRGDLVVEVRIVLPAVLDERSKALLREFGQINPDDVRESFAQAERNRS